VDIIKWFVEVSTVSLASDMSEGMKMFLSLVLNKEKETTF
jgi:hypothetical protein